MLKAERASNNTLRKGEKGMKVIKTLNRALSVLLVAAMVTTLTPDVCLTTYAAEGDEVTTETEEVVLEGTENTEGSDDDATPADDVEPEEEAEAPVQEDTPASDTEGKDTAADEVSDTTDQDTTDGNTAGEEEKQATETTVVESDSKEDASTETESKETESTVEETTEEETTEEIQPIVEEVINDNASKTISISTTDSDDLITEIRYGTSDGVYTEEVDSSSITVDDTNATLYFQVSTRYPATVTETVASVTPVTEYTHTFSVTTADTTSIAITAAIKTYPVSVSSGNNKGVKLAIASGKDWPDAKAYAAITDQEVAYGDNLYIRVEKIPASVSVLGDLRVKAEDDDYWYYVVENVASQKTITASATVALEVTTDNDKNYESVTFTPKNNESSGVTLNRGASKNPASNIYGETELEYGATYTVTVKTESTDTIVKTLTVNGVKKYNPAVTASEYVFTDAVTANGDIDVYVSAAAKKVVTLTNTDGLAITYGDAASLKEGESKAWSSGTIDWDGTLYFKAEPTDKVIDKVTATVKDEDGDDVVTELTASNGVYSVDVTKAVTINFETRAKYAVTVTTNENIASVAWSLTKDGTFTTVGDDPKTAIPKVAKGDKIYLQITPTEVAKNKVVTATNAELLEKTSTTAKDTWEVTVNDAITVTFSFGSEASTSDITFSGDVATSIDTIQYKLSTESTYKTLEKQDAQGDYNFTNDKITGIKDGSYVNIKVTLKDTVTDKFVKSVNSKTPNADGVVTFRVTEATTAIIELGDLVDVTVKRGTTFATGTEVAYKVGKTGTYTTITVPEGETGVKIEKLKKDVDDVYFKITTPTGNSVKSVNDITAETDGTYKLTAAATNVVITTQASIDVIFNVDAKGVVETVNYKISASNPADWNAPEALTVPNTSKKDASVTAEDLVIPESNNVYFKLALKSVATKTIKSVKIGEETITPENGVYTIANAKLTGASVTVSIETVDEYKVTVAELPNEGFTVQDTAQTPNAITAKDYTLKSGEKFDFTITYKKATHKLDSVIFVTGSGDNEVETPLTGTEADPTAEGKTVVTYTWTPTATGTLKITGHAKVAQTVNFEIKNATVKAATTKAGVEAAGEVSGSFNTAIEDETVYFSVTPDKNFKIDKVQYKVTTPVQDAASIITWEDVKVTDGIYEFSLADITTAQDIKVTAVRDEQKSNKIKFAADMDAIEVTYDTSVTLEGDTILTDAASENVTIKAKAGYKVTGITLSTDTDETPKRDVSTANGAGYALIVDGLEDLTGATPDYTKAKTVTVTVTTERAKLAEDKYIKFDTADPIVSYDVQGAEAVPTVTPEYTYYDGTYKLAKDSTDFTFTVIVDKTKKPVVTYNTDVTLKEKSGPVKVSDSKVEYTYELLTGAIDFTSTGSSKESPAIIEFSTEDADPDAVTSYDVELKVVKVDGVTPFVLVNGTRPSKTNDDKNTTYTKEINKDDSVEILISVPENHTLEAEGLDNFAKYVEEDGAVVYKAYIAKMTADVKAVITPAKSNLVTLYKNNEVAEAVKGKYAASKGDEFTVEIYTGSDKGVFTAASVSAKGVTFADDAVKNENGTVTFKVPDTAAGKEVTLTVSYGENESESYKITVAKAVTKLTVKGVKNGALTQLLDTTAAYQITGTKDFSVLSATAEKTKENGVDMAVAIDEKGFLTITTPKTEGSAVVKITSSAEQEPVLDKDGKETGETQDKVLAEFTVTTQKSALKLKSVEAPVILGDSITLKMTADATTPLVNTTNLAFKVVIAPADSYKDSTTKPAGLISGNNLTQYVPLTVDKDGKLVTAQSAKINLCNAPGQAWQYKFTVSLVQRDGNTEINTSANTIEKTFETKNPYYEDKMSLTKKTTTIYTGQEDVLVAVPKFGKNTTYQDIANNAAVEIYDKNGYPVTEENGFKAVWDEEGIKLSIDKWVGDSSDSSLGSFTVKVIPDSGKAATNSTELYAAPATLKINVVRGIYAISARRGAYGEPLSIYRQAGKAVSFKMEVSLNYGSTSRKPKTAKTTYEVGVLNQYGDFVADKELAKLITVSNGTIKISNKYKAAADPADNVFAVRVAAADYKGNDTEEVFAYQITDEKAQLGAVYLAAYDRSTYKYIIPEGTTFTTDEFEALQPIVLKADVEAGRSYYTDDDLFKDVTCTFSNKNVTWGNARHIIAKNITLTATATDGSKVKNTYKFTLDYNKPAALAINGFNFDAQSGNVAVVKTAEGKYEFNANSVDDTITFYVQAKEDADSEFEYLNSDATYNYKISVKGGKLISQSQYSGYYEVLPTAEKVVITLDNKTTGKSVKSTYELKNKSFIKTKAPKVTMAKANFYSWIGNDAVLTIDNTADYDAMYISYDAADYQAKGYSVWNSATQRYEYHNYYNEINKAWDDNATQRSIEGIVSLNSGKNTIVIPVCTQSGTYKLNVTFGSINKDGEFVPETKNVPVKITVKAGTAYKPATKYTMDAKVGYVKLSGSPAECTWDAYYDAGIKIENANVKGQPNKFTTYFEYQRIIDTNSNYVESRLVLKDNPKTGKPYTAEEIAAISKDDLTGYVYYTNTKNWQMEAAKITVSFKANKYTASAVSVMADDKGIAVGTTTIKNGKTEPVIAGAFAVCEDAEFTATVNGNNTVTLTSKAAVEPGKYKIALYVVEAGAYYGTTLTKDTAETIGTKVDVQFTVVDPAKGKVKFDAKNLKVAFTSDDYNAPSIKGWVKAVPYKVAVTGADVKGISFVDAPDYYTLTWTKGSNYVVITADKDKLVKAEADNTTKKSLYKATTKVKANVEFTNGTAEEVTFSITAPAKPQTFDEAVAIIKAAETKELKALVFNTNFTDAQINSAIASYANSLISEESGAVVTVTKKASDLNATAEKAGYYIASLTVTNTDKGATADKNYTSENVKWAVTSATAEQDLATAKTAVEAALKAEYGEGSSVNNTKNMDNSITSDEILAVAKSAVTDSRIDVRVITSNFQEAKEGQDGQITVTVRLSRSIWNRVTTTPVTYQWAAFKSIETVRDDVEALFGDTSKYTLTNTSTAQDVIDLANSVNNNPAITIEFGEDKTSADPAGTNEAFRIEDANKASATTAGYASGTLYIKQEGKTTLKLTLSDTVTDNTSIKVEIKQWTAKASAADQINTYLENTNKFTATNNTDEAAVIDAAKKAIHDPESKLTIAVKEVAAAEGTGTTKSFKKEEATVAKAGSIKVTLVIKDSATDASPAETSEITIPIAQLPQTVEEAATAAEKAIAEVAVSNDTTQAQYEEAVKAVVGCNVAVTFTKENATKDKEGKIELTVTLTDKSVAADYIKIQKTYTIAKLPATN